MIITMMQRCMALVIKLALTSVARNRHVMSVLRANLP